MLVISSICVLIFTIGTGLVYQLAGWKLDGGNLILVCILIINYFILVQSQLVQATARIEELEKRLSSSPRA